MGYPSLKSKEARGPFSRLFSVIRDHEALLLSFCSWKQRKLGGYIPRFLAKED
jgi:hypothetical protein